MWKEWENRISAKDNKEEFIYGCLRDMGERKQPLCFQHLAIFQLLVTKRILSTNARLNKS